MKLELHKSYQARNGNMVKILKARYIDGDRYYVDMEDREYTEDGVLNLSGVGHAEYDLVRLYEPHTQAVKTPLKPESEHKMQLEVLGNYADCNDKLWELSQYDSSHVGHEYRLEQIDTGDIFDFTFPPDKLPQIGFKPIVVVEKLKVGDMFGVNKKLQGKVVLVRDGRATVVLFDYSVSREAFGVITISETDTKFEYCMLDSDTEFVFERMYLKDWLNCGPV